MINLQSIMITTMTSKHTKRTKTERSNKIILFPPKGAKIRQKRHLSQVREISKAYSLHLTENSSKQKPFFMQHPNQSTLNNS